MITYTSKQLSEIAAIINRNSKIPFTILKMFWEDNFDLITNNIKLTVSNDVIYQRMKDFNNKKIGNNHPDKVLKEKVYRIRKVLFEIEKRDLPLYLNDDIVIPLVKWRLSNNI
jgi:hypothetical protein